MKPLAHAVDIALQDGRSFVDPSAEEQAALRLVVQTGLARVAEDRVFRCFDPTDDASTHAAVDRSCFTLVPWNVPHGADPESWEDAGYVVCPRCGREHHPTVDGRTARSRHAVRLIPDGVIAWVDAALREIDPDLRRLRAGVGWELEVDGRQVDLIWLDASAGTALTTRARAVSHEAVWLVTRRAPWGQVEADEPWLVVLPLAQWLLDPRAVCEAIKRARRDRPPRVSEPSLRPWAPPTAPAPRVFVDRVGARVLRTGDDTATLDGHEVVSPGATTAMAFLRVLVGAWREDVGVGRAASDHRTFSTAELIGMARTGGLRGTDDNLGRQLRRLRSTIAESYTAAAGMPLAADAVIDSSPAGWRLAPGILVQRA
jgi:hypothetical protein